VKMFIKLEEYYTKTIFFVFHN